MIKKVTKGSHKPYQMFLTIDGADLTIFSISTAIILTQILIFSYLSHRTP